MYICTDEYMRIYRHIYVYCKCVYTCVIFYRYIIYTYVHIYIYMKQTCTKSSEERIEPFMMPCESGKVQTKQKCLRLTFGAASKAYAMPTLPPSNTSTGLCLQIPSPVATTANKMESQELKPPLNSMKSQHAKHLTPLWRPSKAQPRHPGVPQKKETSCDLPGLRLRPERL